MGCGVSGATGSPSASYTPGNEGEKGGGKISPDVWEQLPPEIKEALTAAGMAPEGAPETKTDPNDIE
jgi:hypothetical protein